MKLGLALFVFAMDNDDNEAQHQREENRLKDSLLFHLKFHIGHAIGGGILLLPFALSQVGLPWFL